MTLLDLTLTLRLRSGQALSYEEREKIVDESFCQAVFYPGLTYESLNLSGKTITCNNVTAYLPIRSSTQERTDGKTYYIERHMGGYRRSKTAGFFPKIPSYESK
jgi:hypothetical protein